MRNNKEVLTYAEFGSREDADIYYKRLNELEDNKYRYKLSLLLVNVIFILITIIGVAYLIYKRDKSKIKNYFRGAKQDQFIDDEDGLAHEFTATLRELDS
ncbi:hypothetical protein [Staphylococcus gallinarum]|jgi:hypothetical protein|uniref:hypothetical protein n=1 Tax=Staphylococcus gallinarum TaxID=1293 RepID=UPI000D1E9BB8|nr:hypothetical protein [Staphylococcus gallinarum]PTK88659.1 hypothetical protein BUZ13_12835 [Staphylococcus gallinarum]PTK94162.1 hypothetical protein BUZ05_05660 [Staphylococcus gallinarum]RIO87152.1 hypothetical protein BUZ06_11960 [Staphylococcus gallinarum]